ncbi:MAG: RidA family protein [Candidatus Levyibacteriota bacterium]
MKKTKINSTEFAKRMGAYSHAYKVELNDATLIFTTGQIAVDKNGNVVYQNNIEKQTEFVFESLNKVLNESGSSLDDVVKVTVFVTDMNYFPKISKVRNQYLKNSEPVSTLIEVNRLAKEGCKIEIEAIAIKNK